MYQYNKRSKKSPRKILFLVPLLVLVLGIGGFAAYKQLTKKKSPGTITGLPEQSPESKAADAKAAEDQKETIVAQTKDGSPPAAATQGQQSPSSTRTTVTPIITTSSTASVSVYIAGINESGGTCTLSITKSGSKSISKGPVAATPSGQKTDCETFAIDKSEYDSAGEWKLTLTYSSSTSQGSASGSIMVAP